MNIVASISLALIAVGVLLDGCNLVWGYQSARGTSSRSGIAVIPFLFYLVGIAFFCWRVFFPTGLVCVFIAGMIHVFCWQVMPAVFDKLLSPK